MKKIAVIANEGDSLVKDENHQTVPDQFEAAKNKVAFKISKVAYRGKT